MERQNYLKFAVDVAKQAGKVLMKYHSQRLSQIWTSATHFRTTADEASETLIREAITKEFPEHGILSEEGLPKKGETEFNWVVDAVDGTINILTSLTDHFAVCIALCQRKVPIIGVVYAPKRAELYTAELGKGAFCNDEKIQVSSLTHLNRVLMNVDSGKHNRTKHLPYLKKLLSPNGITCPMSTGCASVPLVLVAKGILHAYLATSLEPEDMAAAVCIIREAGGKVTNLKGKEWQLGDKSILAANPELHQKLFSFLKPDKKERR